MCSSFLPFVDIGVVFWIRATMNKAAMNILKQVLVHIGFHLSWSGIVSSKGRWMLHFVRNYLTWFQSGYPILHSHQQCLRALVVVRCLKFSHYSEWLDLLVVLICISSFLSFAWQSQGFFHGFLLHLSSSVTDLFKSFAHFSNCAVCVDINPMW